MTDANDDYSAESAFDDVVGSIPMELLVDALVRAFGNDERETKKLVARLVSIATGPGSAAAVSIVLDCAGIVFQKQMHDARASYAKTGAAPEMITTPMASLELPDGTRAFVLWSSASLTPRDFAWALLQEIKKNTPAPTEPSVN